jgi:hypothetical protein
MITKIVNIALHLSFIKIYDSFFNSKKVTENTMFLLASVDIITFKTQLTNVKRTIKNLIKNK